MFGLLCAATSALCVILFAVFVVAPGGYASLYGVAAGTGGLFLGRRAAPLFLGLAVFFWALRGVGPGPLQDATAWAAAATFIGIAVTGVWAWLGGTASFAILVAAALEVAIGLAFLMAR